MRGPASDGDRTCVLCAARHRRNSVFMTNTSPCLASAATHPINGPDVAIETVGRGGSSNEWRINSQKMGSIDRMADLPRDAHSPDARFGNFSRTVQTMAHSSESTGIRELRSRLRGRVIEPTDAAYEAMREIYNAMHDRRPAAIVQPATSADVAATVAFARETGLPLAVRSGGHSVVGFSSCDDGIVLDLRSLSSVSVDAERRLATAGGGATWAQFNDAGYEHGLATPGGVVSTTGIGGLTLGGGIGHLSREYGLACDNVVSAEVVTADASVIRCDARNDADLYWAIRGGGGNFGVVTSFTFRMHPVRDIVGGPTFFEIEPGVVEAFWKFVEAAPREFGALLGLTPAPPMPFVKEEWRGRPVVALLTCWTGEPDGIHDILKRFQQFGSIVGQYVDTIPYPVINTLFDDLLPSGLRHYWKSLVARETPAESIPAVIESGSTVPTRESGLFFHAIDGACHDVAADATAFPHRDARYVVGQYGMWPDAADDERVTGWVRDSYSALRPYYLESEYVNFVSGTDPNAVRSVYRGNYDRLVDVKKRYDPDNLFRLNQNIRPDPG
jgi:FAD/FMN-containing dehydrogenase